MSLFFSGFFSTHLPSWFIRCRQISVKVRACIIFYTHAHILILNGTQIFTQGTTLLYGQKDSWHWWMHVRGRKLKIKNNKNETIVQTTRCKKKKMSWLVISVEFKSNSHSQNVTICLLTYRPFYCMNKNSLLRHNHHRNTYHTLVKEMLLIYGKHIYTHLLTLIIKKLQNKNWYSKNIFSNHMQ